MKIDVVCARLIESGVSELKIQKILGTQYIPGTKMWRRRSVENALVKVLFGAWISFIAFLTMSQLLMKKIVVFFVISGTVIGTIYSLFNINKMPRHNRSGKYVLSGAWNRTHEEVGYYQFIRLKEALPREVDKILMDF